MIRVCFDTSVIIDIEQIAQHAEESEFGWSAWLESKKGERKYDDLRALQYLLAMPNQWDIQYLPNDIVYKELKQNVEFYDELLHWAGQKLPLKVKKFGGIQFTLDQRPMFLKKTKKGKAVTIITDRGDTEQLFNFYIKNRCDIFLTTDYKHILSHSEELLKQYGIRVMSPHQLLSLITGEKNPINVIEKILFRTYLYDNTKI